MKDFITFIKEFITNKGLMVFLSNIINKLTSLLNTIIVVRLISQEEYGLITLIASAFSLFAPLIGLGSYQGLLRYGALEKNDSDKNNLSVYTLIKGFYNHLFVTLLYFLVCLIYVFKYNNILPVVLFFSIRFIGFYFFSYLQSDYRMRGNNYIFSILIISVNSIGLVLAFILTYFYGYIGYLSAMAISPWISLFFFKRKNKNFKLKKVNINKVEFWKYSLHASIAYFLSEMLFFLDIFFIGFLMTESAVAFYKIAIIIPMNLMFLPLVFMQTDFPKITKNHKNKSYLLFYIKNYYKLFVPLGLFILLLGYLLKGFIIPFIFGDQYSGNEWVFFILVCGTVSNMWIRNLYGNLIAAIGKAKWNTYISIAAILSISILSLILIPKYGLTGAALGMTVTFIITGIIGLILFKQYLKSIP